MSKVEKILNFIIEENIGKGKFGIVKLAKHKLTKK